MFAVWTQWALYITNLYFKTTLIIRYATTNLDPNCDRTLLNLYFLWSPAKFSRSCGSDVRIYTIAAFNSHSPDHYIQHHSQRSLVSIKTGLHKKLSSFITQRWKVWLSWYFGEKCLWTVYTDSYKTVCTKCPMRLPTFFFFFFGSFFFFLIFEPPPLPVTGIFKHHGKSTLKIRPEIKNPRLPPPSPSPATKRPRSSLTK